MKKLFICLLCVLALLGCHRKEIIYDQAEGEAADMSWYDISNDNFRYCDITVFQQLVADGKTTIVYLGYENCPWCRELCPMLNEFLREYEFRAYYYDIELGENGNAENLQIIEDTVKELLETDSEGKPILYSPTIIYLQYGKPIVLHEGTVNSHNARERKMTEREVERLRFNLRKEFETLLGRYE